MLAGMAIEEQGEQSRLPKTPVQLCSLGLYLNQHLRFLCAVHVSSLEYHTYFWGRTGPTSGHCTQAPAQHAHINVQLPNHGLQAVILPRGCSFQSHRAPGHAGTDEQPNSAKR